MWSWSLPASCCLISVLQPVPCLDLRRNSLVSLWGYKLQLNCLWCCCAQHSSLMTESWVWIHWIESCTQTLELWITKLLWVATNSSYGIICCNFWKLSPKNQGPQLNWTKEEINVGRHATDVGIRAKASVVVPRWHSWLHITILKRSAAEVKDLPFEGSTLFSQMKDEFLSTLKKNRQTYMFLSIFSSPPS